MNSECRHDFALYAASPCSNLKSNPYLGLDLSSKIGQKTDLRYLILSNYIAIYRVENNTVSIIRIMDGRTDYLRYLLSEI